MSSYSYITYLMSSGPSQDIPANWTTPDASHPATIMKKGREQPVMREATVSSKPASVSMYTDHFEAISN
jgi:hypothetical protein